MRSVGDVTQPPGVHAGDQIAGPSELELAVGPDGRVDEIVGRGRSAGSIIPSRLCGSTPSP